jgi:hypothetical protein
MHSLRGGVEGSHGGALRWRQGGIGSGAEEGAQGVEEAAEAGCRMFHVEQAAPGGSRRCSTWNIAGPKQQAWGGEGPAAPGRGQAFPTRRTPFTVDQSPWVLAAGRSGEKRVGDGLGAGRA